MAEKKLIILYLYKILQETDEQHSLSALEICDILDKKYGCPCERRTIYEEVKRLKAFGMQIECKTGREKGFYLAKHDFDLAELKLLVDAVQSSKFITKEKSDELIKKLGSLTNTANADELQRNVFIRNRIKTENSEIYTSVDAIHAAIRDNHQIRFKYCRRNIEKKLVMRHGGADYCVSPWALTWDDENYYLVAYDAETEKIKHYRVDKMLEVSDAGKERQGKESFENFDLAEYARKTFGMYSGPDRKLTLEGEAYFADVIFDRFGLDVMMKPYGEKQFHATVNVSVSPQFFGWLAGLNNGVRISWPDDIREEYREYLKKLIDAQ